MKLVLSLMDALDDAEEALLRAYLRSGWDDIRRALSLIVRLKDEAHNTGSEPTDG